MRKPPANVTTTEVHAVRKPIASIPTIEVHAVREQVASIPTVEVHAVCEPVVSVPAVDQYARTPSPDPTTPLSDVLLLPEAAAFLRCHPETLKRMAKAGLVPAFRVGSGWRFSRKALTKWTQEGEGNHPSQRSDPASGAA